MLKFDYEDFNKKKLKEIFSIFGNPSKTKVAYFSTYFPNYTRTESVLNYFKELNIDFNFIGTNKRFFKYPLSLYYLLKNVRKYDVIFVAFRGHEILPFVKIIAKIFRKPVIYDGFISVYDTLCFDRQVIRSDSIIGKCLKKYDRFLCQISNTVLVDTKTHCEYFKDEFQVNNVDYIYVGCNKKIFKPLNVKKETNKFTVFWYGSSNPVHGVEVILQSARIIQDITSNVMYQLVGPVKKNYQSLLSKLNLKNITLIEWIPYKLLPDEIAKANLCLGGHFAKSIPKANRVIAGKTYQFVNMKKPTILGENSANLELFDNNNNEIFYCEMGNANQLANTILKLSK